MNAVLDHLQGEEPDTDPQTLIEPANELDADELLELPHEDRERVACGILLRELRDD